MNVLRTMYDSDRAADIPSDVSMVGGYVDGVHPWSKEDWRRFHPATTRVRIARHYLTMDAHVLDSEVGLASVGQTVTWVAQQWSAGRFPGVYCNLARWSGIQESLRLSGVQMPWFWVAHWTGKRPPALFTGALALQYADPKTSGGHFDLSVVAPFLPGVDPRPAPVTIQKKGEDVELTNRVRDRRAVGGTSSVEEALSTVLGGITGEREAGALYLLLAQTLAAVEHVEANVELLLSHAGLTPVAHTLALVPAVEDEPEDTRGPSTAVDGAAADGTAEADQ